MSGEYFHGSHEEITEIAASGVFGGLFDEHGTTWLCLPGCVVSVKENAE